MNSISKTLLHSFLLLFIFCTVAQAQQTRLYVKKGSTGDGSSWTQALGELTQALTLADQSSSTIQEIWVSEGTYLPATTTRSGFSLQKANLKLVGGFAGTESSVEERTIGEHPTILSGNISPNQTYSTNILIQITATGIELDGFTVTGNNTYNATKSNYPAIYITRSYTTLKNLRVEHNSSNGYGGGIYIYNALEVRLENSLIQNNTAQYGGGIYCNRSKVSLSNVKVAANTATLNGGGGIYANDTRLSLSQTIIQQNTSLASSDPLSNTGGGGISYQSSADFADMGHSDALEMHNVILADNASNSSGGGLLLYGLKSNSATAFNNVTVRNNAAVHNGGGIFSYTDNTTVLSNFIIEGNTAARGAGVYVGAPYYFQLTNSIVRHNVASDKGGGFYNDFTYYYSTADTQSYVNIVGSILSQNSAINEGAELVLDRQYSQTLNYNMNVANSIIYNSNNETNHVSIASWVESKKLNFVNSIVSAANVSPVSKIALIHSLAYFSDTGTGYGNIAPEFLEPTLLFKSTNATDNNYLHPEVGSILQDTGLDLNYNYQLPSTDLAGNPRKIGNFVDIGPFEVQETDPYQAAFVLHVKKGATGTGLAWDDALGEVSEALQIASRKRYQWTTENPLKILVAKGSYRPAYRANESLPTSYNTFRLPANVQLYGGFDPDQGISALTDTRQPADYDATILSGDLDGDDTRTGRASTLTLNNYTDNAKHVVMIIGEVGTAKLQGFKIVGSNAINTSSNDMTLWGETVNDYDGGAIWISSSNTLFELNDVYFEHNIYQNGAIYHARPLVINNSKFRFNKSNANTVLQTAQPITVRNTLIEGNHVTGKKDFFLSGSTTDAPSIFENITQVDNHYEGERVTFHFIEASDYAKISIRNSVFYPISSLSEHTFNFLNVNSAFATSSVSNSLVQRVTNTTNGNISATGIQPQAIFRNYGQYDYRPSARSPLINAGSNSLYTGGTNSRDLANNPRIQNTIDIGAYEWSGAEWSAAPEIAQLAQDEPTYLAGEAAVFIDADQNATIIDNDSPNFDAGILTVSVTNGTLTDHQLHLAPSATITLDADSVYYQNVAIAKVLGLNTQTVTFHFSATANTTTVSALLQQITYRNRNQELADSRFNVQTTLKDGGGGETVITSYIKANRTTIGITFSSTDVPYFVNENFVKVIDPQVTLSIPQTSSIQTIQVSIPTNFEPQDVLSFTSSNGFTSQYDANTGILTIEGSGSLTDWQNALRTVTYSNPEIVTIPSYSKQLQVHVVTVAHGSKSSELLPITFKHNPDIGPDRQHILYVNKNGSGSLQTGRSWNQTIRELGDALKWAYYNKSQFSAENPLKIFVAKGIYHPIDRQDFNNQTMGMDFTRSINDRNNAFYVVENVEIYGGFDPSNGIVSLEDERILMDETNGTILSGDYSNNDVITGAGSNLAITNNTENSKNIVNVVGTKVRLDGLVIKGAYNRGDYSSHENGSPLSIANVNEVTLNHLVLTGNRTLSGCVINSLSKRTLAHQITVHKNLVHIRFSLIYLDSGEENFTNTWSQLHITDNYSGILDTPNFGYNDTGILQVRNQRLQLVNAQFSKNYITNYPADSRLNRGLFTLENVEFSLVNSLVYRNEGPDLIHSTSSSTRLLNTSLIHNFMRHPSNADSGNNISAYNSIVLYNSAATPTPVLSTITAKNSLIQGVAPSAENGLLDGTQQIDLSLFFTDADRDDYTLRNDNATNGRTLAINPLINAGDATLYDPALLGIYDLAGNDRIRDGQIDLGPYELQRGDNPLPVRLISFQASNEASQVLLTWHTADEQDFSHFEVERSKDGKTFAHVTQVTGGLSHYATTDILEGGTTYYRLKMVDLDGSYSYSKLVSISPTVGSTTSFSIYPNPVIRNSHLTVSSTTNQTIKLIDLQGRLLHTYSVQAGEKALQLPTLPTGIYLLQNQVGEVRKLVVE